MDILLAILTIYALAMILWLAGKGTGSALKWGFSSVDSKPKPWDEYPYERVRLFWDTDNSGRFEAFAHRCKATGTYEAYVSPKREDMPLFKIVTAATKEELENKICEAYQVMAEEWKEEMKLRRWLNDTPKRQKRKKK